MTLPGIPSSANNVCLPKEVNIHRQINLHFTPQHPETQQPLNELFEEYKDFYYDKVI